MLDMKVLEEELRDNTNKKRRKKKRPSSSYIPSNT